MTTNGDDATKVVPVRHYGQWVASFFMLVFVAMLVHTLFSKIPVPSGAKTCHVNNGVKTCQPVLEWRFSWTLVHKYLTAPEIMHGLLVTIELTAIAMFGGIVIGVIVAIMRLSSNRLLSSTAWIYTWFFRGTPVYVQLFFWFGISALYPSFSIGVPFTHITLVTFNANTVLAPFTSAAIALSLNEGAYMAEIARAGLIAVDEGQSEAASSLGMTRGQTLRYVVLPQAMRVIIPPTGNELISMLKTTSLVSAVGVLDLFGAAQDIAANIYNTIPLLIVASIWYIIITTILSIGQFYVERHYAKGALRTPPPTPLARLVGDLRGIVSKMRTPRIAKEVRA